MRARMRYRVRPRSSVVLWRPLIQDVGSGTSRSDVRLALTGAKCLTLLQKLPKISGFWDFPQPAKGVPGWVE
jgi:hypothetical protein